MPRTEYQLQLKALKSDVLGMSELVLERYETALTALEDKDAELAHDVIDGDDEVNGRYLSLESECIDLLALQQPVAGDLRLVASSFKIITDLERVGDLAVNLSEYALAAERERYPEIDVMRIGREAGWMLEEAMDAYATDDVDRAREIAASDDRLDELCADASEVIVYDLLRTDYGDDIETVVDDVSRLLLTVRDLERVGDHAVNVCARTVYMVENDDELIY